jgi:hypothetical protein
MLLIAYGTRTLPIGVEEQLLYCTNCQGHHATDLMVSTRYFHVYNLPVMPLDKSATVFCQHCGSQRPHPLDKDTSVRARGYFLTSKKAATLTGAAFGAYA